MFRATVEVLRKRFLKTEVLRKRSLEETYENVVVVRKRIRFSSATEPGQSDRSGAKEAGLESYTSTSSDVQVNICSGVVSCSASSHCVLCQQ